MLRVVAVFVVVASAAVSSMSLGSEAGFSVDLPSI